MRKTGTAVLGVAIVTALLVGWLTREEVPATPEVFTSESEQAPVAPTIVVQPAPARIEGTEVVVEEAFTPARTRKGRVVDSRGRALEGAVVKLLAGPVELSNEAGEFDLGVTGQEHFEVSHPCCITAEVKPSAGQDLFVITLQPAAPIEHVTFAGVVVDEDGRSVAGASVAGIAVSPLTRTAQGFSVTSDSAGRFSVELALGSTVEVRAKLGSSASVELEAAASDDARLILLERAGVISGRVVDEAGAPVTDFQVDVGSGDFSKLVKISSPDGTYELARIPQFAKGMVWVSSPGFLRTPPRLVTMERRGELRDVNFKLERGRSISGVVFDRDTQAPLAHAIIRIGRDSAPRLAGNGNGKARSDSQGRFVLQGVPEGRLEVRATRSDYLTFELVIAEGSREELRIGLSAASGEPGQKREYEGVGMKFDTADLPGEGEGYVVTALHPEGGARVAGIQLGDRILAVDTVTVGSVTTRDFLRHIKGPEGSVATLTILRGGRSFQLHAVRRRLGEW